ncbi:hypothetical protein [Neoroseomonas soli]|uniref:Uncharacterized protein n=1 Tax=Neoroseomonas soli TaxID=1081025 RepID=A0A9X9X1E0_9PROT|nr:hypothetical protein [Neoroseomonas soli]MBR0673219.1 hypothetical protein [Neoroseomonas soli]
MTISPRPEPRGPDARPWGPQGGLLRRTIANGAKLFGAAAPPEPPAAAPPLPDPDQPPAVPPAPRVRRRDWTDRLWGEGLAFPGGAAEVLRLASLLPLAPEATLLLAGGGARAAASLVSGARGCFVAAFEPEALATDVAAPPRAPVRKVTTEPFDAAAPGFRRGYHHHALLLEPFRVGGTPDLLMSAAAQALRPGGQVVLVDLVARGSSFAGGDARWLEAEGRAGAPPAEDAVPAAMERAGFAIHVVEDAGPRHRQSVIEGWRALLQALREQDDRPDPQAAGALVAEAEAWLLRLRLMKEGRLRLLRWHASMMRPPG